MAHQPQDIILHKLDQIEAEHDISILYAVESGSRAWSFESTDSDFDVRFIYKHELSWYLNILPKPDVIEYPIIDRFDYSGWDLRKALFLMNKSNPPLFEWLNSPIIYKKEEVPYRLLKDAALHYFSPMASIYHYLHMARGNNRDYLQGEIVKIKKYFYVLRPLLACMWIEQYQEIPPVVFEKLLLNLDLESLLIDSVLELLKKKQSGIEMGLEPRIPCISNFVDQKITYYENYTLSYHSKQDKPSVEFLDKVFVEILSDAKKSI